MQEGSRCRGQNVPPLPGRLLRLQRLELAGNCPRKGSLLAGALQVGDAAHLIGSQQLEHVGQRAGSHLRRLTHPERRLADSSDFPGQADLPENGG